MIDDPQSNSLACMLPLGTYRRQNATSTLQFTPCSVMSKIHMLGVAGLAMTCNTCI